MPDMVATGNRKISPLSVAASYGQRRGSETRYKATLTAWRLTWSQIGRGRVRVAAQARASACEGLGVLDLAHDRPIDLVACGAA